MGKISDDNMASGNQSRAISVVLQVMPGIFGGLIELFTLSDEEIIRAGINVGKNKYEEPIAECYNKIGRERNLAR